MTAKELALKMKAQSEELERKEEEDKKAKREYKMKQWAQLDAMIRKNLSDFGPEFTLRTDYSHVYCPLQLIGQSGMVILSCCLKYVCGNWDPSDDVRNVPFEEWQIFLCAGRWQYDKSKSLSAKEERFVEEVAKIMQRYV